MKQFLVWITLILLAYFAADIIEKGEILNALTPFPVLGYVLWGACALVLWVLLIWPVIQFIRLKSYRRTTPRKRLALTCKRLKKECGTEEKRALYKDLRFALAMGQYDDHPDTIKLLEKYEEICDTPRKQAKRLINQYSKLAGVAVVISRSNAIDALALIILQMKMVIELSRIYGFRPSPVFNCLCFGWVVTHSIIFALFSNDVVGAAADAVGGVVQSIMQDPAFLQSTFSNAINKIPLVNIATAATKPVAEALLAAIPVFVTGRIFLKQLEGEKREGYKDYLDLRKEAYSGLFKSF